jgi:uncharacterized protein YndB with AHSA1/START domain
MSVKNASRRTADQSDTVLIERIFAAPRELVFEAWTNPEYLLAWFAPRGCTIHFSRIDVRSGGGFHSCIRNPQFGECWCVGIYHEVVRPERIVHTLAIADSQGRKVAPAQAGHHPDWPAETLVTVTFEDHRGGTKLTLRQNVLASLAQQTGALPSWLEMFDRLKELLSPRAGP